MYWLGRYLMWWPWPIFCAPMSFTHFMLTFNISSTIRPTTTKPCIELLLNVRTLQVAWQTIHMKCQDLFSLKNKKKTFRMSSATNFAWRCKDYRVPTTCFHLEIRKIFTWCPLLYRGPSLRIFLLVVAVSYASPNRKQLYDICDLCRLRSASS